MYVFHAVTHERILVRKNCWKYGREVGSSQCKNRYTVYFLDKKERELFGVRLLESLLIVVWGGVLAGYFMSEKYGCAVPVRCWCIENFKSP